VRARTSDRGRNKDKDLRGICVDAKIEAVRVIGGGDFEARGLVPSSSGMHWCSSATVLMESCRARHAAAPHAEK
jgi:hypothetical protein